MISEAMQIAFGIILLVAVFILTRIGVVWRVKRACVQILGDLKARQAFEKTAAVELPYAKLSPFRIGLRDYRPKALESLVHSRIVVKTADNRYYLGEGFRDLENDPRGDPLSGVR